MVEGEKMKQVPVNILISVILLAAVFVVANQGFSYADASTTRASGIIVDSIEAGHVRLHGFGFRPGSLVNLELRERAGGKVISGANVWVDVKGGFDADFDLASLTGEAKDSEGNAITNSMSWVVFASSSTGSLSLPLSAQNVQE